MHCARGRDGISAGRATADGARNAKGGGHAVLTVVTDLGDFILDNREQKVLLWKDTDLKRQSQEDLNRWVSLVDEKEILISSGKIQAPTAAAARVRR
ncbi:transglutaminase-like cysteine peptidase [Pseudaminobacter soli (ex Zhang et al. 2022)]|uniref:transglutaminase-like cysteine peptidase n=1 Tax=Pseudaminobacter soli (ex Zhang et al. 2022) TaxID=2831468 RepID=UPI00235391E0|nr:transglutaminase-like cysteine peptidase [Pseudaminobacter soli]